MSTLSEWQRDLYEEIETYFREELDFPPFRELPDEQILDEIAESPTKFSNPIIIIQAVTSFFPPVLQQNPLVQFWILHRLRNGKTPLKTYDKNRLSEYHEFIEPSLIHQIKQLPDLGMAMVRGVNILFPPGEVEYYFKLYVRRFGNLKDFFSEREVQLLDTLMDDIWISRNYDIPLSDSSNQLALEIEQYYQKIKDVFTKEEIWNYFQDNHKNLSERYRLPPIWLNSKEEFEGSWKEIAKRMASFALNSNSYFFGIPAIRIFIQMPNTLSLLELKLIEEYFHTLKFLFLRVNRTLSSEIWVLSGNYHNIDQIRMLLKQLKQKNVIIGYYLVVNKTLPKQIMSDTRFPHQSDLRIRINSDAKPVQRKLFASERLVYRFMRTIISMDLKTLPKFFRAFLQQELHQIDATLKNINQFSEKVDLPHLLLPDFLKNKSKFTIQEMLIGTNFSLFDAVVYFKLLSEIISRIVQMSTESQDFDLKMQFHLLEAFMDHHDSRQQRWINEEELIHYIQEHSEDLPYIIQNMNLITIFLNSCIYKTESNIESLQELGSYISSLISLNDAQLSKLFRENLRTLFDDELCIPSFYTSFQNGVRDFSNILFHHPEEPDFSLITGELSVLTVKYDSHVSFITVPYTHKALWKLGKESAFQLSAYERVPYVSRLLSFCYDSIKQEYYDVPLEDFVNSMNKFASESEAPGLINNSIAEVRVVSKSILTSMKKILNKQKVMEVPPYQQWSQLERILQKDPSYLLHPQQDLLTNVQLDINWPYLGLEKYIALVNVSLSKFTFANTEWDTRQCLLLPGIQTVYGTADSGLLNKYVIHYIFPYSQPNPKLFNWLANRKVIADWKLLKVKKIHRNTVKTYFIDPSALITGFRAWESVAKKILSDLSFEIPITTREYEYAVRDSYFNPDSEIGRSAKSLYGKNLRVKQTIKVNLPKEIYWLLPDLSKFYVYPIRIAVFMGPLTISQLDKILRLFSLLPSSELYECCAHNDPNTTYLLGDLQFFNSHIEQFLKVLQDIMVFFSISEYNFIPKIVPLSFWEFGKYHDSKIPPVFKAHIWNQRSNKFQNKNLFDSKGIPLSIQDRFSKR